MMAEGEMYRVTADGSGRPTRIDVKSSDIEVSDGYHTFSELYAHRRALTAVLACLLSEEASQIGAWRSKAHHPDDDPMFEGGYFIVGINLPTGTITYHYKLKYWDDFAAVPEVDHAPKWDSATPDDTVTRLLTMARSFGWNRGGR